MLGIRQLVLTATTHTSIQESRAIAGRTTRLAEERPAKQQYQRNVKVLSVRKNSVADNAGLSSFV